MPGMLSVGFDATVVDGAVVVLGGGTVVAGTVVVVEGGCVVGGEVVS
jgi:hypothetical protein